jgi:methylisocitrate lyase
MVEKIKTASENRLSKEFILIARTDARGVDGIEAAIERGQAYREAGADMIFPEGLRSEEEFAQFSEQCPGLLLANMTEFGKTPHISASRFEELAYNLVIYPVTFQRVAMAAVTSCLQQLLEEGSAEGFEQKMQTRQELYDLLGYVPGEEWRFSNK